MDFINKLHPVTYQMNTKQFDDFIIQNMSDSLKTIHQEGMDFAQSTAIVRSGFIAQEVDSVAHVCGFTSSIVHTPDNNADPYGLSYAEFVVPLVKAVQELSKEVNSLKSVIAGLTGVDSKNSNTTGYQENIIDIKLDIPQSASLGDAQPNPNNGNTQITYFIPENSVTSKVSFTDMLGNIIYEKTLQHGYGTLNIDTQGLPVGIYVYNLIINGKNIATKKMICN
ncbi:MAG: T9SS type A sorting domain-containing protein [Bacteroidales bacterium]|nr:T9SS type A sorting domain-containing protein [Bacteroidales bacterium]